MGDTEITELYNDANDAVRCRGELARLLHEIEERVKHANQLYRGSEDDRHGHYLMGRRDEAERLLEILIKVQQAG